MDEDSQLAAFLAAEGEEDEEEKEHRLALERKKKREEILKKYASNGDSGSNHASTHNSTNETTSILLQSQSERDKQHVDGSNQLSLASGDIFGMDEDEEQRLLEAEKMAVLAEEKKQKSVAVDIFSSSPVEIDKALPTEADEKSLKLLSVGKKRNLREALMEGEDPHLQSNWDDGEGYYRARIGEVILGQYRTLGVVGKGVFSTVLKCATVGPSDGRLTKVGSVESLSSATAAASNSNASQDFVAIKMVRNNDVMRKAAEKERSILALVAEKDPLHKKHCVLLLDQREYRNHMVLVFEYLPMNLRETLKKFGKDVGINIGAVRLYARQLFLALKHLSDLRVVHADIKLDNILCSEDLKQVKLCDFGSAFFESDPDNLPTPYLVSRFYRAPEIILGQQYDRAIDLWSVAVSLYELFTGHVMFPGRTNNEMLKLMMSVKGRISVKQIKNHIRQYDSLQLEPFFEQDLRFRQVEHDPVSGKMLRRLVDVPQHPSRDLGAILKSSKAGADDLRLVNGFVSLIDQCINLDPSKRITVREALKHPFLEIAQKMTS